MTNNPLVNSLLTDTYQITMAYAYFRNGDHEKDAVFELFFRKNPFKGEFSVFAGLTEALEYIKDFKFTDDQISFINKTIFNNTCDDNFINWLRNINTNKIKVRAIKEGTIVFPRVPLMSIEGPIAIVQLLETALLNLVNFSTLMATNAARFRYLVGNEKKLLEFGLRRAQGPDGAMSASRYSYLGGFDATSNVQAGHIYNIPIKGTHAHSFVTSFTSLSDLKTKDIFSPNNNEFVDFVSIIDSIRTELGQKLQINFYGTNNGELAAFISYAQAFPNNFLALIDTYDTLASGVLNFLLVATALHLVGYKPVGIRLDSGDLAYLSKMVREYFNEVSEKMNIDYFKNLTIVASNDLDVNVISSLKEQEHEIDSFGVGTNLVTCKDNPALGGVYKLVEIDGKARIKLSQEKAKITIPGKKRIFRLYLKSGEAIVDLMTMPNEEIPKVGEQILCVHPFDEDKRILVTPNKVEEILEEVYLNGSILNKLDLDTQRDFVLSQLKTFRSDHLRFLNPAPFKVSLSCNLYKHMHELKQQETPLKEFS